MKIALYHNRECGSYLQAIQALEEALIDSDVSPLFIIQLVQSDEEARKYGFLGSPTVRINGRDVDAAAESVTVYRVSGCRIYEWRGKTYDHPPKEMIMDALKRIL